MFILNEQEEERKSEMVMMAMMMMTKGLINSCSVIGQLSKSHDCELAVGAIKSKGIATEIR